MFEYKSISELVNAASSAGRTISEVVLADQAEQLCISPDALYERMDARVSHGGLRKGGHELRSALNFRPDRRGCVQDVGSRRIGRNMRRVH